MAKAKTNTAKPLSPANASPSIGLERFKAEIEKLSKEIYLKRLNSKTEGDALSDWLQAEKAIKEKHYIV